MPSSSDELHRLLVDARGVVAPSVSALVWRDGREVFAHRPEHVYDLASLTKVLCTTELALASDIDLDAPDPLLPPGVTPALCLQHTAGFLWWKDLTGEGGRDAILRAALREPLVTPPGTAHRYSDLGFLALGAVIEARAGARIDALWRGPLRWGHPAAEPTEDGLRGVVHDENARAMGGVAPHAGLFGAARDVLQVALRWLDGTIPRAAEAVARKGLGSHALGWDTPSGECSSAGPAPPPDAVGHTGFTGTSVWMSRARGTVAVLLTNRVVYGREPGPIRALRHAWHAAAWEAR